MSVLPTTTQRALAKQPEYVRYSQLPVVGRAIYLVPHLCPGYRPAFQKKVTLLLTVMFSDGSKVVGPPFGSSRLREYRRLIEQGVLSEQGVACVCYCHAVEMRGTSDWLRKRVFIER